MIPSILKKSYISDSRISTLTSLLFLLLDKKTEFSIAEDYIVTMMFFLSLLSIILIIVVIYLLFKFRR
jgi:heme/copper-type cytochrome/quinol oxidase subunit 2